MKQNSTVLGLSIAVIFAITIIAISATPTVMAKSDTNGQPDLVAILIAEGSNDAKGKALFWFNDDASELRYKIVLNKVDVGSNGQDKNAGEGLEYYVTKLHIHAAPGGVHTPMHLFNIIGPADDSDLKIAGHTFSGIWDDDDAPGVAEHVPHQTKTLSSQIGALCTGNTDVNVHLNAENEFIRGIINANSDACSDL
jgi:hypothetical protein